jgi:hypothetical protein
MHLIEMKKKKNTHSFLSPSIIDAVICFEGTVRVLLKCDRMGVLILCELHKSFANGETGTCPRAMRFL